MYSQHQSLNLCYTILQSSPHLTQASASHVLDTILWTIATEHAVLLHSPAYNPSYSSLKSTGPCTCTCICRLKIESSPSIGCLAHHHHLLYLTYCMSCQTISSSHHPTINLIPSFSICIMVLVKIRFPVYGDRHCQKSPSEKGNNYCFGILLL